MSNNREWLNVFTRVNNRKRHIIAADVRNAGYPETAFPNNTNWKNTHDLCQKLFVDGKGRRTYVWFGATFFFTCEEDVQIFKTIRYLV